MELQYYQEFIELAKVLNYHAAAANLCISQSALSKHIAALEQSYQMKLFNRSKREVALTKEGAMLLESANLIWNAYANSLSLAKSIRDSRALVICGTPSSPGEYISNINLVKAYHERNSRPISFLQSPSMNADTLAEIVLSGDADCAIGYDFSEALSNSDGLEELRIDFLDDIPIDAVVADSHVFAERESLRIEDLAGSTFTHLAGPQFTPTWRRFEAMLTQAGVPFSVWTTVITTEYDYLNIDLKNMVMLMPRNRRGFFDSVPNLRMIPIESPGFVLRREALSRRDNTDRDSLNLYFELLRENL